MTRLFSLLGLLLLIGAWPVLAHPVEAQNAPDPALDARAVVTQAVEALGGQEAWNAVQSMEIIGDYSTFSTTYPFRILRQRPNLYRFEHHEADMQVVVGYDGRKAWWHNQLPLFAGVTWPTAPSIPYARGFEADAEFAGWPFLDAARRGHQMTYSGIQDFEGLEGHVIHMTLAGGTKETWYFDTTTFLPSVRVTRAGYVGRDVDSRTFFSNYRTVEGLKVPYLLEFERGNLFGEMVVDAVQLDVEPAADAFTFPRPPLMQQLAPLEGRWRVTSASRPMPNLPWMESPGQATFTLDMDGRVLREELSFFFAGRPRTVFKTFTFDRFSKQFRIAQVDDLTTHINIFQGTSEPVEGRYVLDNGATGTAWGAMGPPVIERQAMSFQGPDHFQVIWEQSPDGERWIEMARFDYHRDKPETP